MTKPLGPNLKTNIPNSVYKSQTRQEDFAVKLAENVFNSDPNKDEPHGDIFNSGNKKLIASYEAFKKAEHSQDPEAIKKAANVFTAELIMEDVKDGAVDLSPLKPGNFGLLSKKEIQKDDIIRTINQADKLDDGKINGSIYANNPELRKYVDNQPDNTVNNNAQSFNPSIPTQSFDLANPMANLASLDPLSSDSDPFGVNQINKMFMELINDQNQYANIGPYQPNSIGQSGASGKVNQAVNLGIPLGGGNLKTVKSASGAKFNVNEKVAPQFQAFIRELESMGYKIDPQTSGGFNFRKIAGTNTFSQHAYGNAIDINSVSNGLGKGKGNLPDNIREIAAKYGLTWGGDFKSNNDPMHFEVAKLMPNIDTNSAIG